MPTKEEIEAKKLAAEESERREHDRLRLWVLESLGIPHGFMGCEVHVVSLYCYRVNVLVEIPDSKGEQLTFVRSRISDSFYCWQGATGFESDPPIVRKYQRSKAYERD